MQRQKSDVKAAGIADRELTLPDFLRVMTRQVAEDFCRTYLFSLR